MTIAEILTAITQVGFPIVACGALFWSNYKSEERHKEESKNFNEAINNNTKALTVLTERLHFGDYISGENK